MFRSAVGAISTEVAVSFNDTSALLGGGSPTLLVRGNVYRFHATELCHVHFHATSGSATATSSTFPIPPFTPVFLTMPQDQYCAVIRNTTNGVLVVSKMVEAGLL
jgi:hypothetical protein